MARAVLALALSMAAAALLLPLAAAEPPESERSALRAFLSATPHERALNWTTSLPTCSWTGVRCSSSTVTELHLPGVGLIGSVPAGTISQLQNLEVLSLRDNRLHGPVPTDLLALPRLRALYLQGNLLSGSVFPSGLAASMAASSLEHLALSRNSLSGTVPESLLAGGSLRSLLLDGNRLSGSLPAGSVGARLEVFNVSFNDFDGPIPASLARFPPDSFAGNPRLCGAPLLDRPCVSDEKKKKKRSKQQLSEAAVVAIAVGAGAAALLLALLLLLALCLAYRQRRRRQRSQADGKATPPTRGGVTLSTPASGDLTGGGGGDYTSSSKDISAAAGGERGRLVFVGKQHKQQGYSFDLEDLLRASAEVLGKGMMGTSYKAVLEEGATVVVKRLRDVAIGRREFGECVEAAAAAGEGHHRNLVPLRGYYYSKDEKLLVLDFVPGGSLSARLHGSRGTGRTPMDWESRTRAALCAARGVAHLHTAHGLPHGDIKSSNLLLRPADPDAAALSDYCLHQLFFPPPPPPSRVAVVGFGNGYRAPELLAAARRPTLRSDVYALGVLFLELLTGRSPGGGGGGGGGGAEDLPRWVQSVVREEWTAEVFDADLVRAGGGGAEEEEMVALLQVAMACVCTEPEARPDAADVVRMVEEVVALGGGGGRTAATEEERSRGPTP